MLSGTYAFGAILAALHQRQRTGHGQLVDVSMLESMLTMTLAEIQRAQFPLPPPGRPMFGPLETRDGYVMLAVASERTFADLARAAGREDWLADPRFAVYRIAGATGTCSSRSSSSGRAGSPRRSARPPSTAAACRARPIARSRRPWPIPSSPTGGPSARCGTPRGPFGRSIHRSGSRAPAGVQPYAAALGEHSDEVLAEAGYTAREIEEFRKSGALG